jgi:hypothetical protein
MSDEAKPDRSPWPPLGTHLFAASTLSGRQPTLTPSDELQNEDDWERTAHEADTPKPSAVTPPGPKADLTAELLSEEEDGEPALRDDAPPPAPPDLGWPVEPAVVPRAAVPPPFEPPVRPSRRTYMAWWVAAGCAALAITEAGIIIGLIPARWGFQTAGVADLRTAADPGTSGSPAGDRQAPTPGTIRPTPSISASGGPGRQGSHGSPDEVPAGPAGVKAAATAEGRVPGLPSVLPPPPAVTHGWVSIQSPLELQVREGERLIGLTTDERLGLAPGRHVLTLSNPAAAFETSLTISVESGRTSVAAVAIPNGSLSLNALPWATVTLDGQALTGTTPFAGLEVPLGPHAVVWTHPDLGVRSQTVIVTAKAPMRVVMDMRVK